MYLNKKKYHFYSEIFLTKITSLNYPRKIFFSQYYTKNASNESNNIFNFSIKEPISSKIIKKKQLGFDFKLFSQFVTFDFESLKNNLLILFNFFSYEELKICINRTFNQEQKIINYRFDYLVFDYIKKEINSSPDQSFIFDFCQSTKDLSIIDLRTEKNVKKIQAESSFFQPTNFVLFKNESTSRTLITFLAKCSFFIKEKQKVKFFSFKFLNSNEKENLERRFFDFYVDLVQKKLKYEEIFKSSKKIEELTLKLEWTWFSCLFFFIAQSFFEALKSLTNYSFSHKLRNKTLRYYKIKQIIRCFWSFYFKLIFFNSETIFESKSLVYKFPLESFSSLKNKTLNVQPIEFLYNLIPSIFRKSYRNFIIQKRTKIQILDKIRLKNIFDFLSIGPVKTFENKGQKLKFFSLVAQKFLLKRELSLVPIFSKFDLNISIIYKTLFDFLKKYFLLKLSKNTTIKNKVKSKKKTTTRLFLNISSLLFKRILRKTYVKKEFYEIKNWTNNSFTMRDFEIIDQKPYFCANKNNKKNLKLRQTFEQIIENWDFLNIRMFNSGFIEQFLFFNCEFLFVPNLQKIEQKNSFKLSFLIRHQLIKIKTILKNFSAQPQISVIKKLTPKFYAWSYQNRFSIFLKLKKNNDIDYGVTFLLWRWGLRRHNNKAKHWIKRKYFYCLNERNWIFGNFLKIPKDLKNSKKLIYLPSHFQILFFLKQHWFRRIANFENAF